jgi:hypothetical protein
MLYKAKTFAFFLKYLRALNILPGFGSATVFIKVKIEYKICPKIHVLAGKVLSLHRNKQKCTKKKSNQM